MEDSAVDDYYMATNDNGFENYIPNTYDPGAWMTMGVALYSLCCVLIFLPVSVIMGNMCNKKNKCASLPMHSSSTATDSGRDRGNVARNPLVVGACTDEKHKKNDGNRTNEFCTEVDSGKQTDDSHDHGCDTRLDRSVINPSKTYSFHSDSTVFTATTTNVKDCSKVSEFMTYLEVTSTMSSSSDEESDESFKQQDDTSSSSSQDRNNCTSVLSQIVSCDKETIRILKLGGPISISTVSEEVMNAIFLAIVSKYLGVHALSAVVVTHLLVGLTDTFIKGVADALDTLCSHAIGTENFSLAGQYVQIALVVYTVVSLPVSAVWWIFMEDAIRLFGMNEQVVVMGAEYTKVLVASYFTHGTINVFLALLNVSGYETPASIAVLVEGASSMLTVWGLLHLVDGMNLFWVGVASLVVCVCVYILFGAFVVYRGWIDPFWHGMTHTFALKNIPAVKNVLKTAIPLSFGSLLEYGEWEALTFFAAALGPAEVVAWGILESIWDLFEAATEGLAEAGSMRLAYHLGRGDVSASKLSCWKTLFISTLLACTLSSIFLVVSPYVPHWFTNDATLIEMVQAPLPLIGIGNIFMVFGMTSWSLIGAQGRYNVATVISALMSIGLTLPLAALFCIGMRYSLISLVGAVVVGYSTTGLFLGYILQMSDWVHISNNIRALNENEDDDLDSSSSSEDGGSDEEDIFKDHVSLPAAISKKAGIITRT